MGWHEIAFDSDLSDLHQTIVGIRTVCNVQSELQFSNVEQLHCTRSGVSMYHDAIERDQVFCGRYRAHLEVEQNTTEIAADSVYGTNVADSTVDHKLPREPGIFERFE